MRVRIDGRERRIWPLFAGNRRCEPAGLAPSYRSRLADGDLDVRIVDGDRPLARLRLVAALATGTLADCPVCHCRSVSSITLESTDGEPVDYGIDGEVCPGAPRLVLRKLTGRLIVYRPRGANRIYGVERDRPFPRKYGTAVLLTLLAGAPMAAGMAVTVAGGAVGDALGRVYHWPHGAHLAWVIARWPVGAGLALLSVSFVFRRSPRRRQPTVGWLAFGAGVAIVLWLALTGVLAWYVEGSTTFGTTYGPLTAIMALMVWANLTATALFYGLAGAAQLEAARAGGLPPVRPDPGP